MPIRLIHFALVILSFTWGCLPFPHMTNNSPGIHGKLLKDGIGGSDTLVRYLRNKRGQDPCVDSDAEESFTDDNGEFQFEGQGKLRWFLMQGDCVFLWALCFKTSNKIARTWEGSSFGPCSSPDNIKIICSIDNTWSSDTQTIISDDKSVCRYLELPPLEKQ